MTIPTSCSRSGSPSRWAPSRRLVPASSSAPHRRCRSRIRRRLHRRRSHAASSSGSAGTRTAPLRTSIAPVRSPRTLRSHPRSSTSSRRCRVSSHSPGATRRHASRSSRRSPWQRNSATTSSWVTRSTIARWCTRRSATRVGRRTAREASRSRSGRTRSVRRAHTSTTALTSSIRRLTSHAPRP